MPRSVHATRVLPKLVTAKPVAQIDRTTQRLWNAKRRLAGSKGLTPPQLSAFKEDLLSEQWRNEVSSDVKEFVDEFEADGERLLPEEKERLFRNPARYFSRPQNVPTHLRKQIYFPDFHVALRKSPHLGPYFAQFEVPLWFSKLDLKSYLKELYNVDVVHIRSWVRPGSLERERVKDPYSNGPAYREEQTKKMTCQLTEPFTWPKEDKDIDREKFRPQSYWEMAQKQAEISQRRSDYFGTYVDEEEQRSIAKQAKEILTKKAAWSPTWQSLPTDTRIMQSVMSKGLPTPPPSSISPRPKEAARRP